MRFVVTRPHLGLLFRARGEAEEGAPPEYSASEIGDVNYVTVEVTFDQDIYSPTTDYKTGVTVKINSISQTISTATRQANHALVYYVIAASADANDVVTWEYDDDFGDIEAEDDGEDLLDVSAQTADNWVGSHLYFNQEDDCVWVGAV